MTSAKDNLEISTPLRVVSILPPIRDVHRPRLCRYHTVAFTSHMYQGCHNGSFWMKMSVWTSFSFGRPRTSSGRPPASALTSGRGSASTRMRKCVRASAGPRGRGPAPRDVIKDDFGGKLPSGRPFRPDVRPRPRSPRGRDFTRRRVLPSADAVKTASARTQPSVRANASPSPPPPLPAPLLSARTLGYVHADAEKKLKFVF
jgi:hypothetical protein